VGDALISGELVGQMPALTAVQRTVGHDIQQSGMQRRLHHIDVQRQARSFDYW
jgi:hypothetical protein